MTDGEAGSVLIFRLARPLSQAHCGLATDSILGFPLLLSTANRAFLVFFRGFSAEIRASARH